MSITERQPRTQGGRTLAALLRTVGGLGGRILVAGPHDSTVLDVILEIADEVTLLLRSVVDAEELAAHYQDRAGLTVISGALEWYENPVPFDAVVALAGLDVLRSMDGSSSTWAEHLGLLRATIRPDGMLLLGTDNEMGVERLVEIVATGSAALWRPRSGFDATKPHDPAGLDFALHAHGLRLHHCYAGYPKMTVPAILLPVEIAAGHEGARFAGTVSGICGEVLGQRPVLSDPRRLAAAGMRTGRGADLAPMWVAVASGAPDAGSAGVVVGPVRDGGPWGVVWTWQNGVRELAGEFGPVRRGRVIRDPHLLAGPLPEGALLEELLVEACGFEDTPRVRELLTEFANWLEAGTEREVLPGHLVFATVDNVLFDGQKGWTVQDPSWALTEGVPFEAALARILGRFTMRLLAEGHRHPWPAWLTAGQLCERLLAAIGRPAESLTAALVLEAEITAAITDTDEDSLRTRLHELMAAPARPLGLREAHEANELLLVDLHELRGRLAVLEDLIAKRDQAIIARDRRLELMDREVKKAKKNADAKVKALRASKTYRAGRALTVMPRAAGKGTRLVQSKIWQGSPKEK